MSVFLSGIFAELLWDIPFDLFSSSDFFSVWILCFFAEAERKDSHVMFRCSSAASADLEPSVSGPAVSEGFLPHVRSDCFDLF